MNNEISRPTRSIHLILNRVLTLLALLIVLFVAGVTIAVFLRGDLPAAQNSSRAVAAAPKSETNPTKDFVFTGIGRLRLLTAGKSPATVVLDVTFPYNATDKPFSEELAAHVKDFRNAAKEYIGSFTVDALKSTKEDVLKSALLARFNDVLRLGKIRTLYFNDFMIVN
jgi:flagellar basal body-associated protein FliL